MDDPTVRHRRARLQELVREIFASQADMIRFAAESLDIHLNQGELSALRKANGKSFREVKARTLESQLQLAPKWFDLPLGTAMTKPPHYQLHTPDAAPYGDIKTRSDEDLLMRAFRAAEPAVRAAWLDQARGIIERIHTPSLLSGNAMPRAG